VFATELLSGFEEKDLANKPAGERIMHAESY
jgi:hypothetical protein